MPRKTYKIQSVDNALAILEALCEKGHDINLTAISNSLDMKKSLVFRMLATFEERGYVERTERRGYYRLGLNAFGMGHQLLTGMDFRNRFRPLLNQVVERVDEAVYLAIGDQTRVLLLDMVDTTRPIRIMPLIGKFFPLQTTVAGKVMVAFGHGVCGGREIDMAELAAIRAAGGCSDRGGFGEGIASVAVPLGRLDGWVPGSLCVVGPDFRLTEKKIEREILPVLSEVSKIAIDGPSNIAAYPQRQPLQSRAAV